MSNPWYEDAAQREAEQDVIRIPEQRRTTSVFEEIWAAQAARNETPTEEGTP